MTSADKLESREAAHQSKRGAKSEVNRDAQGGISTRLGRLKPAENAATKLEVIQPFNFPEPQFSTIQVEERLHRTLNLRMV